MAATYGEAKCTHTTKLSEVSGRFGLYIDFVAHPTNPDIVAAVNDGDFSIVDVAALHIVHTFAFNNDDDLMGETPHFDLHTPTFHTADASIVVAIANHVMDTQVGILYAWKISAFSITSGSRICNILCDVGSGERVGTVDTHPSDADLFATGNSDGGVNLWSISSSTCIKSLSMYGEIVQTVMFAPSNPEVIVVCFATAEYGEEEEDMYDEEGMEPGLGAYSIATWTGIRELCWLVSGDDGAALSMAIHPYNQDLLVVASQQWQHFQLFSIATGQCIKTIDGPAGGVPDFSRAKMHPTNPDLIVCMPPSERFFGQNEYGNRSIPRIEMWSLSSGGCTTYRKMFKESATTYTSIAFDFHPTNQECVQITSSDGVFSTWEVPGMKPTLQQLFWSSAHHWSTPWFTTEGREEVRAVLLSSEAMWQRRHVHTQGAEGSTGRKTRSSTKKMAKKSLTFILPTLPVELWLLILGFRPLK